MFQSTHPRGVRRWFSTKYYASVMFQSTHPRGVRLFHSVVPKSTSGVSIHAPAWGATISMLRRGLFRRVSIHAPAWGATKRANTHWICFMFQSTHPRGVRQHSRAFFMPGRCFNPRTRVGCDLRLYTECISCRMFQSTHPRGVRRR